MTARRLPCTPPTEREVLRALACCCVGAALTGCWLGGADWRVGLAGLVTLALAAC